MAATSKELIDAIVKKFPNPGRIKAGDRIKITAEDLTKLMSDIGLAVPTYPAHAVSRWRDWQPNFKTSLVGSGLVVKAVVDVSIGAGATAPDPTIPKVKVSPTVVTAGPTIDPDYFHFPPETPVVEAAIARHRNVYLAGPAGCGKTELAMRLCNRMTRQFYRVNFDGEFSKSDFVGDHSLQKDPAGGASFMTFIDGVLPTAMKEGAVLILDEFDAAPPEILFVLQSVLEGKPLMNTRKPEKVIAKTGFCVISTANTVGKGDLSSMYAGTRLMNMATLDRFSYVLRIGYPPEAVERDILIKRTGMPAAEAQKLTQFMNAARKATADGSIYDTFSMRKSLNYCDAIVKDKLPLKLAFRATILDRSSEEDKVKIIEMASRFWPEIK